VDYYDPFVEKPEDPYPSIADVGPRCPVAKSDAGWSVALGYKTIEGILRKPDLFSNRGLTNQRPERDVLAFTDPPRHTRHRRLLFKAFTPQRVEQMQPHIEEVANDLVDALPATGGVFELLDEIANPLPMRIITEMLGVPDADREKFRRWSQHVESAGSKVVATPEEEKSHDDLNAYVLEQIRLRRASESPPDDLITAIAYAEIEGDRLTEIEGRDMVAILLTAGNGTTTNALANTVWAIESHPSEKAKLLADVDGSAAGAVEEGLRFDGPIHGFFRTVKEETVVEGETLAAGSRVFNCYASASHDPDMFPDPDQFLIDRDWNDLPSHLAFGLGIHYCIGANLARMEATIGLKTMYRRLENLRIEPGFLPKQKPGGMWRSWESLRLAYDRVLPRAASDTKESSL
jgi:cytochrome P450